MSVYVYQMIDLNEEGFGLDGRMLKDEWDKIYLKLK